MRRINLPNRFQADAIQPDGHVARGASDDAVVAYQKFIQGLASASSPDVRGFQRQSLRPSERQASILKHELDVRRQDAGSRGGKVLVRKVNAAGRQQLVPTGAAHRRAPG